MREFFLGAIFGAAVAIIGVVFGVALGTVVRKGKP